MADAGSGRLTNRATETRYKADRMRLPDEASSTASERQQVLDRYLADASPEDRQQWIALAEKLDPRELELALENSRATRQLLGQEPAPAAKTGWGHGIEHANHGRPLPETSGPNDSSVVHADRQIGRPQAPAGSAQTDRPGDEILSLLNLNIEPESVQRSAARPVLDGPSLAAPLEDPTSHPVAESSPSPHRTDLLAAALMEQRDASPTDDLASLESKAGPGAWNDELLKLINLAESDLAELVPGADNHDDYVRRHVNLRLLYLVAGQPSRAVTVIPGIGAAEQEFWQQQLWALSEYFADEHMPNRQDRITETLADMRRAIHRMRGEARLQIRNMNFCNRIASFGVYDRIPEARFRAGQQILIYAEIENFRSEEIVSAGKGQFKTKLSSTLEIYADDNPTLSTTPAANQHPIRIERFSPTIDMCHSARRDYFNAYTYQLSSDLTPGHYRLVLTVRDELGTGYAAQTLNFEVLP